MHTCALCTSCLDKVPTLDGCSLTGEFWLGLRSIRALLARGNTVLHVQLEDWKQGSHVSEYNVYLSGPEEDYAINLRLLSGDLPDPMGNLTGMAFSTRDRQSYQHSNCAFGYTGAADLPAIHIFDLLQRSRRSLNIPLFPSRWLVVQCLWRCPPEWEVLPTEAEGAARA